MRSNAACRDLLAFSGSIENAAQNRGDKSDAYSGLTLQLNRWLMGFHFNSSSTVLCAKAC